MDEERRKQIEEEERYRLEVRAQLEREQREQVKPSNLPQSYQPTKPVSVSASSASASPKVSGSAASRAFADTPSDESFYRPTANPKRSPPKVPKRLGMSGLWRTLVIVGGLLALVAFVNLFSKEEGAVSSFNDGVIDEFEAIGLCRGLVRDKLVSPSTAKFVASPNGGSGGPIRVNNSWLQTEYVDSQNPMGATLRSTWVCEIAADGSASSAAQLD